LDNIQNSAAGQQIATQGLGQFKLVPSSRCVGAALRITFSHKAPSGLKQQSSGAVCQNLQTIDPVTETDKDALKIAERNTCGNSRMRTFD